MPPIHAMLQDQIKVFSQRVEEFGDNQTLSSEWNSFVRFATIAGVRRQPRELKEELLKMLPKVGQGYTCPVLIPGDVGSL